MKYQYLNLEQKLIKVRKKIPVLVKQFHSEEVGYDFSKLDDIYELMTPALNKYGVNFDIVGEKPTMCNEAGHPVYLIMDNDGYWRYEADLIFCWTNVDSPEEQRQVTIHAVGTHEIPDKAKGAAWTYSIKYYLRNKFCVRQDSENDDPDMRGTETPENLQEQQQEQQTNSKQKTSRQEQKCEKKKPVEKGQESGETKDSQVNAKKNAVDKTDVQDVKSLAQQKTAHHTKEELHDGKQKETAVEKPAEEKKSTQEAAKVNQADEFEPVSDEEEIPFDDYEDCEFMADLNEELEKKETEYSPAYEEARNYMCNFGLFKNKTLGEMYDAGEPGLKKLRWIADGYKGADRKMVKAAQLLLNWDSQSVAA